MSAKKNAEKTQPPRGEVRGCDGTPAAGSNPYPRTGERVQDMTMSRDGERLVTACPDKKLRIYRMPGRSLLFVLFEVTDVSSLSLSADGNLLLVSCHASSFLQPEATSHPKP
mmetsp:Transcript_38929/g.93832  ORF Transcript_38929/g.93832 Transcript_38929/m.93832 type:complete len:112 (+) Transcript_38929:472-807(+)